MIRSLVLSFVAILSLVSTSVRAETPAASWIKVATFTIDPRTGGTKTIDLPGVAFRELRFAADRPVTLATVKTSSGGAFKASGGSYSARPGARSASFFVTKDPAGLKQIQIAWSADPAATGPVKLEVWALTGQGSDEVQVRKKADDEAAMRERASAMEARRAAAEDDQRRNSAANGSSGDITSSRPRAFE
ncbi:MAG: hypothetical protein ABL904_14190, partial [Hyphomicrobiaceae bacterium]